MQNDLENVQLKIFNLLKSKDRFKYLNYSVDFILNKSKFNFGNGIYLEFDKKLNVYFAEITKSNNPDNGKQYLNYATTYRVFESLDEAIEYINYLEELCTFRQLEQYFYFEYLVRKNKLPVCTEVSLQIMNNMNVDEFVVRIDVVNPQSEYWININFFSGYTFEVSYTPKDESFSKHKRKTYTNIDDLFHDLEKYTFEYDSVLIEEVERELW